MNNLDPRGAHEAPHPPIVLVDGRSDARVRTRQHRALDARRHGKSRQLESAEGFRNVMAAASSGGVS